jgi:uncharacterized protein YndB with AHSA1/START domain
MEATKARGGEQDAALQAQAVRQWRRFAAPRETVFEAWSSAEHVRQWFAPEGFTPPRVTVEMRKGGIFEVRMRGPDGTEQWARGRVVEVSRPSWIFRSRMPRVTLSLARTPR